MWARASPSVASVPEYSVTLPTASMAAMVRSENRTRQTVCDKCRQHRARRSPIANPASEGRQQDPGARGREAS